MSNKRSRPVRAGHAAGTDNLRQIDGISQTMEQRLNRVGVQTYAQLAALTPEEIARLLGNPEGLRERVRSQNWVGQAQQLSAPSAQEASFDETQNAAPSDVAQPYETFAVELLLNAGREVIHTRVMHVTSGEEEIWGGWQEDRLASFFVKRAALHHVSPAPATDAALSQTDTNADETVVAPVHTSTVMTNSAVALDKPAAPTPAPGSDLPAHKLEILSGETSSPVRVLNHEHAFAVRLRLDLNALPNEYSAPLPYSVMILTRNLADQTAQNIYRTRGELYAAEEPVLEVKGLTLPPGVYRVDAAMTINRARLGLPARHHLQLQIAGGVLQVY